ITEAQLESIAGLFESVLRTMSADPSARHHSQSFVSEQERHKVLVEWNQTEERYEGASSCLHDLVARQAVATPDAVAVLSGDEQLTYRELDARANRLARHLRGRGVGAETPVAVMMERSLELAVALLGVLKAGGAYVPLDPAYPRDRLSFMLDDANVGVLVTERGLLDALPVRGAQVLLIDDDEGESERDEAREHDEARERDGSPRGAATPDNLAYVIYTSGSTGIPKGVSVTHRNLVNFLCAMRSLHPLVEGSRLLGVTTLSFDIAALELYLPLVSGASVAVASAEEASDPALLREAVRRVRPHLMQATPALWRALVEAGWRGDEGEAAGDVVAWEGLRALCGGEAWGTGLARELTARAGGGVWNMYGPTETTVWSATRCVLPADEKVLVGRPVANTEIYLLDKHLRPVPVGAAGELYIGGEGVARGYLNRPRLTAERFVPDPYSGEAGARLYRTGDVARYTPEGEVEFVGRADQQVKLRGYRIELGEIEAALSQHPAVAECAAAVKDGGAKAGGDDKRLVAYVVLRGETGDAGTPAAELREYLSGRLPSYMVPQAVVTLERLPLTAN
ncbi:MAG TPA: amino acid adenylation domain-containing protein, partial [Pyrinomonadaceae bacterium]|nr:amino acid adenylation domain-containing protein [Pyrinomonadaceae bacterium]